MLHYHSDELHCHSSLVQWCGISCRCAHWVYLLWTFNSTSTLPMFLSPKIELPSLLSHTLFLPSWGPQDRAHLQQYWYQFCTQMEITQESGEDRYVAISEYLQALSAIPSIGIGDEGVQVITHLPWTNSYFKISFKHMTPSGDYLAPQWFLQW